MVNIEIRFRYQGKPKESDISSAVYRLLSDWVRTGQVLHGDWPITHGQGACRLVVGCPETTALAGRNGNAAVGRSLSELSMHGLSKPSFHVLGPGLDSPRTDRCRRPSWYILITNFLSVESPLHCGDHYLPIPLYRIPWTDKANDNHQGVLYWQSLWRGCDQLQMNCDVGEEFATRQIADPDTRLSKLGRERARDIENVSGVPTYYYLYRGEGRSLALERKRRCPSCGGRWLLPKPIHFFQFRCGRCRLVSHMGWGWKWSKKAPNERV